MIRWRYVLLVIAAVLAMAYSRQIAAAVGSLPTGGLWSAFCEEIAAMPRLGKYAAVLMVLGLLYLTAYFLIRESIRHR